MRIDAHQHFWKYNPVEYNWIGADMQVLKRDFMPADLKIELESCGFSGSIAVQARQSIEETIWLLDLADKHDFIKGVVGWVDLCSNNLLNQLEIIGRSSKLVGVRHVIQDEPDENFMLRKDFLSGIAMLEQFGLTYDLLIFPRHLSVADKLVKMFPKQKFVLDHIAKPDIKHSNINQWQKDIQRLAENRNVYCKLSGMVTEADLYNWKPIDFIPYLNAIFEAFGHERLMIGSDWPVCTLSGNYIKVVDIVTNYIKSFPKVIQESILGENCITFYGLK